MSEDLVEKSISSAGFIPVVDETDELSHLISWYMEFMRVEALRAQAIKKMELENAESAEKTDVIPVGGGDTAEESGDGVKPDQQKVSGGTDKPLIVIENENGDKVKGDETNEDTGNDDTVIEIQGDDADKRPEQEEKQPEGVGGGGDKKKGEEKPPVLPPKELLSVKPKRPTPR